MVATANRRYGRLMGLKDVVLGWLRQGQAAGGKLEKAEADIVERDYQAAKTDARLDSRLGSGHDAFDADETEPR